MEWLPWIDSCVREILTERVSVLDHWRSQVLTKANRVKNFENWMLVELVHRLLQAGVQEIKTNGYIERPSYPLEDAKTELRGNKAKTHSISPDLAFRLPDGDLLINAEMKTQTSSQEIIDDARLVKYHNEHEKNSHYRACFLWVVVAPAEPKFHSRVQRSATKIVERLAQEDIKLKARAINGRSWLNYSVSAPGL